jgi:hypothetical protein
MPPLKPGTLVVEFFAEPSSKDAWPASWSANFEGSIEDAKLAARATLKAKTFPLAVRYQILDHNYQELYAWPEKANAQGA